MGLLKTQGARQGIPVGIPLSPILPSISVLLGRGKGGGVFEFQASLVYT